MLAPEPFRQTDPDQRFPFGSSFPNITAAYIQQPGAPGSEKRQFLETSQDHMGLEEKLAFNTGQTNVPSCHRVLFILCLVLFSPQPSQRRSKVRQLTVEK